MPVGMSHLVVVYLHHDEMQECARSITGGEDSPVVSC
jgi:hypothetical protein